MFRSLLTKIMGDPNKKILAGLQPYVTQVAQYEAELKNLSHDGLRERTSQLRAEIGEQIEGLNPAVPTEKALIQEVLDEQIPLAYALVREASRRATGLRHYDVQIMGGVLLNQGHIVEMRTGEGKTLVATLPLFLNALAGFGVHLVTVNDYLVKRDGGWMGKIFNYLGLSVGCIGAQQFSGLYDPEYVNPGSELEDERLVHWRPSSRREAYLADVTYGISSEFGFDYLRDNMVHDAQNLVQRPLYFAVIDEVDNVLIDEARTPLIISGPAENASSEYGRFSQIVKNLRRNTVEEDEGEPNGHYTIDEKSRSITLTEMGTAEIERRLPELDAEAGDSLYDPRFFTLTYYLDNALKAEYLFHRNKEYTIVEGEVVIIDDFTGRLMHGRRYSDGLHEAIEAKEGVEVKRESVTVATITIQNYFRLYKKLAGMTGTAMTDAEEFQEIYKVEVTPLPTNVEYMVEYGNLGVQPRKEKVDGAERIAYVKPGEQTPSFFKRLDFPDQVYVNEGAKDQAIVQEVKRMSQTGRPVLVGTTSVEHSEVIHGLLTKEKVPHKVLNAKMHQSEALIVAQAGRKGAVTISTNMAGRGTDILLGGNPEGMAAEALEHDLFTRTDLFSLAKELVTNGEDKARTYASKHSKLSPDLVGAMLASKAEFDAAAEKIAEIQITGYLAHQFQEQYELDYTQALHVLQLVQAKQINNGRLYLKELGKDTVIADEAVRLLALHARYQLAVQDEQKMAQFLADQIFDLHYTARAALIRAVLGNDEAQSQALTRNVPALPASLITQIQGIRTSAEQERRKVWELGGLHVVGSERHESRRIDNQLRGRAARQGDPGSSRFFLSLEDDLMRRFGGERVRGIMTRNMPDDLPIENRALDRIIASSQQRIEGYNFDIRKNVLEYDDVMAKQRETIYDERRKVLMGESALEERLADAFDLVIDELVSNYLDNYQQYVQGEVDRAIEDLSAEATDTVNVLGVLRRLQRLLPVHQLQEDEGIYEATPKVLRRKLMKLAQDNEANGRNLYQLLQAMRQFLPILPPIPNLAGILSTTRTNHLQVRGREQQRFMEQLRTVFDDFLAQYINATEREQIWNKAVGQIDIAFNQFSVQRPSAEVFKGQQQHFQIQTERALRELMLDTLSALDSDTLVDGLAGYVQRQRTQWRNRIGEVEFARFERFLILNAIDREWRDYLTAADDLRREIGLESAGRQRDPKVEYKKRSYEMFAKMRESIQRHIAELYFRQVSGHDNFIREQQAKATKQQQLTSAGYQVVQRQLGKGVELRREVPKVGRNEQCPCGSGKKYKNCHGRAGR